MSFGSMPSPVAYATIEKAFKSLKKAVSPGDAASFNNTTLQDVQEAALQVEARMSIRTSLCNMRRLMPLFTALSHYSGVMGVLCNGTPFLAWVWAPIKLVLTVASEYVEAFDVLIGAYHRLALAMPRIELLRRIFESNNEFQDTLAVYYANILAFHGRAYEFVHRRGWRLLFKTSWGRFKDRFEDLLEGMRSHECLIDAVANAHNIAASEAERVANKNMREKLDAWLAKSNNRIADAQNSDLAQFATAVAWLQTDESASDQITLLDKLNSDGDRFPGTCSWLLQNKNIKSWLGNSPDPSLLLMEGTPGVGKSVLAAKLVSFLRTSGKFAVCHFCSYAYAKSITFDQVLRSLILQLLRRDPELVSFAVENYVKPIREPTVRVLKDMLADFLATLSASVGDPGQLDGPGRPAPAGQPERIWIVVDGLDECTPDTQADIIFLLQKIINMTPPSSSSSHFTAKEAAFSKNSGRSSAGGADVTCKIMIASRPTSTITKHLRRRATTVSLYKEKNHIAEAIRCYTKDRLEKDMGTYLGELHIGPPGRLALADAIVGKADGMFLYARLLLDYLSANLFYSGTELLESVNALPAELATFYCNVLNRVIADLDRRSFERLRCLLGWVAFAKRPLKKLEFLSAVTFSQGDPSVEHLVPRSLLDKISALIEERGDMTLGFIHVSVKDFLQDLDSPIVLKRDLAMEQQGIASITCLLAGLELFRGESSNRRVFQRFQRIFSGIHGLHVYATEYWEEYLLSHVTSISGQNASGDRSSPNLLDLALQLAHNLDKWSPPLIAAPVESASTPASIPIPRSDSMPCPIPTSDVGNMAEISEIPRLSKVSTKQVRDKRLSHLEPHPLLHRCVVAYKKARSLSGLEEVLEKENSDRSALTKRTKSFPTSKNAKKSPKSRAFQDGVTALLASYQTTLRAAFTRDDFPGISAFNLQQFKTEFHSARYTCRLAACSQATIGLDSLALLHKHEAAHLCRSFPCIVPNCYSLAPTSADALREHMRRYHSDNVPARKMVGAATPSDTGPGSAAAVNLETLPLVDWPRMEGEEYEEFLALLDRLSPDFFDR